MEASDTRLATYLSDHLAGSEAAIRLVGRYARDPDPELAGLMRELAEEIEADREELTRLMARLGARPSPVKKAGAVGAELLTSLRGRVPVVGTGSHEVARLEDLELLCLGIQGKLLLWRALEPLEHPAFEGSDLGALARRAEDQRDRLEPFRRRAAAAAFGGSG
jgi:hypothetical protein